MTINSIEHIFVNMIKDANLPQKLNARLAEEVGIHIGDGSLNVYDGRYLYSLRGHLIDDERYYIEFIPELYKEVYGVDVNIRKWPDVIGFQLGSVRIGHFKHDTLGLPLGSKANISIPHKILNHRKFSIACLRGIFDTDGCLSFEKKSRKYPYYPRIIFSTTSEHLNKQLIFLLEKELKFNLSSWKQTYNNKKWNDIHRTCIRGERNLKKWFKLVRSNNPKNIFKYEYWKEHMSMPE